MEGKNLWAKFGFVFVLLAVSVCAIMVYGLKRGPDIAGGYSMIFEVENPNNDGKLVEDNVVYVDSVYLEGTVASDTGIVSLRWRSDRGGGGNVQLFIGKFGETNLNGKWRIPKVPLAMGANTITIEAKSVNGKLFSKQVTIYRR